MSDTTGQSDGNRLRERPRGRGRPREFDLGPAVAIAADLFRARGYDRVTLNDLTGAMGINPPSFYAAFGNKALLFSRIADGHVRAMLEETRAAFEGAPRLDQALGQIVAQAARRSAWRTDADGVGRGGCLILEAANNCGDALVVAHLRKARLAIAAALYRGIARDAPGQVSVLTDHVMTLLAGLSAMGRDGMPLDRLAQVADRAADALTAAIERD